MKESEFLESQYPAESRSGWLLFSGLVVLLLSLGAAVGWATYSQRQARHEAEFYTRFNSDLRTLLIDALDAETGQRGYLITGNPDYLAPYVAAKERLASNRASLENRLLDPRMKDSGGDGSDLWPPLDAKLTELDSTVALFGKGERERERALATVNTDAGKRAMDTLRAAVERRSRKASASAENAIGDAEKLEKILLPLEGVLGMAVIALAWVSLRTERRRAIAARSARDAAELRRANERAELLLRELNHRVKNIFAVIIAIVTMTSRRHPEAKALAEDLRSRLHGLSLAHSASMDNIDVDTVPLRTLLERTLDPYRGEGRIVLSGDDVAVPDRATTPLGLIVHELATNAAKYGALAEDNGHIEVYWEDVGEDRVVLRWIEQRPGGATPPIEGQRQGFGTQMLDLAARQLGGSLSREWREQGLAVTIEFNIEARS